MRQELVRNLVIELLILSSIVVECCEATLDHYKAEEI